MENVYGKLFRETRRVLPSNTVKYPAGQRKSTPIAVLSRAVMNRLNEVGTIRWLFMLNRILSRFRRFPWVIPPQRLRYGIVVFIIKSNSLESISAAWTLKFMVHVVSSLESSFYRAFSKSTCSISEKCDIKILRIDPENLLRTDKFSFEQTINTVAK